MPNTRPYSSRELLHTWLSELNTLRQEHASSARFFEKLHWKLGIPSVILAALLTTSIWSRESPIWTYVPSPALWRDLIPLGVSIVVLFVNAIITFLGPGDRSSRHKSAYATYDTLFRELQCRLTVADNDLALEAFLADFRLRWRKANDDAPTIRASVLKKVGENALAPQSPASPA